MIALRRVNADTNDIRGTAPAPVTPSRGRLDALWRVGSLVVFAVLPVLTLATMLAVGLSDDSLSADFHHEIYPQAKQMLEGHNPYPPPDFDPTVGAQLHLAAARRLPLSPLTLLPLGAADVVMLVLGLACIAARSGSSGCGTGGCTALVAMWPQIAGEMRVSHLTAPLCLLLALAWRSRDRALAPGVLVGFATALKFFVWPLGGLARGDAALRPRRCSRRASPERRSCSSSRYVSIDDYARSLLQLGRGFDQDSYTLFGLLVQSGASETAGRIAMWACGARPPRGDLALPQLHACRSPRR